MAPSKTFDVPGASKANGQGTFSESVNASGQIAGFYYYTSKAAVYTRGFTRDAKGLITTFDGGPRFGTIPVSSIDSRWAKLRERISMKKLRAREWRCSGAFGR